MANLKKDFGAILEFTGPDNDAAYKEGPPVWTPQDWLQLRLLAIGMGPRLSVEIMDFSRYRSCDHYKYTYLGPLRFLE